jgi:hypothetical protein
MLQKERNAGERRKRDRGKEETGERSDDRTDKLKE